MNTSESSSNQINKAALLQARQEEMESSSEVKEYDTKIQASLRKNGYFYWFGTLNPNEIS